MDEQTEVDADAMEDFYVALSAAIESGIDSSAHAACDLYHAALARAEAAEAEAARLKEAGRMVQEEVTAWRDSYEALNEQRLALAARVAELESQLAAQGSRPVTEDWPPYGVKHLGRAMLNSPTLLVTRTTDDSDEVWQDNLSLIHISEPTRPY